MRCCPCCSALLSRHHRAPSELQLEHLQVRQADIVPASLSLSVPVPPGLSEFAAADLVGLAAASPRRKHRRRQRGHCLSHSGAVPSLADSKVSRPLSDCERRCVLLAQTAASLAGFEAKLDRVLSSLALTDREASKRSLMLPSSGALAWALSLLTRSHSVAHAQMPLPPPLPLRHRPHRRREPPPRPPFLLTRYARVGTHLLACEC